MSLLSFQPVEMIPWIGWRNIPSIGAHKIGKWRMFSKKGYDIFGELVKDEFDACLVVASIRCFFRICSRLAGYSRMWDVVVVLFISIVFVPKHFAKVRCAFQCFVIPELVHVFWIRYILPFRAQIFCLILMKILTPLLEILWHVIFLDLNMVSQTVHVCGFSL